MLCSLCFFYFSVCSALLHLQIRNSSPPLRALHAGHTVANCLGLRLAMCFVRVKEDEYFRPARTSRRVRVYSESPPRTARRVSRAYMDDRRVSYTERPLLPPPPPEMTMRSTYTRSLPLPPPVPSYSLPPSTKPGTVVVVPSAPQYAAPSKALSKAFSKAPTAAPSKAPTAVPSKAPTPVPSKASSLPPASKVPSRAPSKAPSRQSHYVEVNEESDTESDSSAEDDVRSHATHKTSKTVKTSKTEKSSHSHKSASPPTSKVWAPLSEFSLHEREREIRRYRGPSHSGPGNEFATYQYVEAPRI